MSQVENLEIVSDLSIAKEYIRDKVYQAHIIFDCSCKDILSFRDSHLYLEDLT